VHPTVAFKAGKSLSRESAFGGKEGASIGGRKRKRIKSLPPEIADITWHRCGVTFVSGICRRAMAARNDVPLLIHNVTPTGFRATRTTQFALRTVRRRYGGLV
jgi:hypothetical protein